MEFSFFIVFFPDSSPCTARFVTNDQFTNVWTSFVYEYTYSGSQGENYCAMKCLMEYYERCHFYWLHNGYCYFGNFGSPGWSVLSSDWSGETIKMFQPSLYGEYKLSLKLNILSISGNNNLMTFGNFEAILRIS